MYVFNKVFTKWLPLTSFAVLFYTFFFFRFNNHTDIFLAAGLILYLPVIIAGLTIALRGSDVHLALFFKRPANIATLLRAVLMLLGLGLALFGEASNNRICTIIAAVLIVVGLAADFLDGWLARHEGEKPPSSLWGGWFDAESDALILLLSCLCLFPLKRMPLILIIPAIARYVFGPVYLLFPVPLKTPRWFFWYSKTAAAIFQFVIGFIWVSVLLLPGSQIYPYLLLLQTKILIPMVCLLIIVSFIIEGYFRLRTLGQLIPREYRKGILKSYFIYYIIPFRRFRMRRFYKELISEGSLAFDVGAHLGNRTRTFLDIGASVVAFEPQPVCAALLGIWFGEHRNVSLNSSSLGPANKPAEILISPAHPSLASLDSQWVREMEQNKAFKQVQWSQKLETKMISLDSAIAFYGLPQFIKIDTEGFEQEVLKGLSTAITSISFEFLPGQLQRAENCLKEISRLGDYSFNFSRGESMKFHFRDWQSIEVIRGFIYAYPEDAQSGDIYAKLQ